MAQCKNCTKVIPDNINFCPYCGTPVAPAGPTCQWCKHLKQESNQDFCPKCGCTNKHLTLLLPDQTQTLILKNLRQFDLNTELPLEMQTGKLRLNPLWQKKETPVMVLPAPQGVTRLGSQQIWIESAKKAGSLVAHRPTVVVSNARFIFLPSRDEKYQPFSIPFDQIVAFERPPVNNNFRVIPYITELEDGTAFSFELNTRVSRGGKVIGIMQMLASETQAEKDKAYNAIQTAHLAIEIFDTVFNSLLSDGE